MYKEISLTLARRQLLATVPILLMGLSPLAVEASDRTAYDCVITPSQTVDISSPVSGTLSAVLVDRSDRVAKGQIVARLDSGVETAAAALARAKANLDSEEEIAAVNLKFDGERLNRFLALYGVSMTSSQDKDDAERNVALSRARLQYAKAMREVRQLELQTAEAHVAQKVIRSPIDGVVLKRYKTVSEYVEAQPIVRVVQLDPLYVEAIVPMEQFGKIEPGMHAWVFSDAFQGGQHQATVQIVDRMGDAASGTFGVRLELQNPSLSFPAGVKCNVQIVPDESPREGTVAPHSPDTNPASRHTALTGAALLSSVAAPISSVAVSPSSSCTSLGPYASESAAQPVVDLLDQAHVSYSLRKAPPNAMYLLLAPAQETKQLRDALIERLREAEVHDLAIVEKGKYRGRIALGVFGAEENSIHRTSELAKLGFSTEIHRIQGKPTAFWIDVINPGNDMRALTSENESLRKLFGDHAGNASVCPDRLSS